ADLRRHLQEIPPIEAQFIGGNLVDIASRQRLGEGALAGSVRSHNRVHLAGTNIEVEAAKDRLSVNRGRQIANAKHYPILPSRLTPRSLRASTANSIGSSCRTCLQNPLMIVDTASSGESPRCWQ